MDPGPPDQLTGTSSMPTTISACHYPVVDRPDLQLTIEDIVGIIKQNPPDAQDMIFQIIGKSKQLPSPGFEYMRPT